MNRRVGEPRDEEDRMPYEWNDRSGEESWGDTEAWRGDLHAPDDGAWIAEDETFPDAEPLEEPEAEATWRGEDHLPDWPEELAGPEYWLYKRMSE
jgi:hypothetical protein